MDFKNTVKTPAFVFIDGNQASGKFIRSDASGNASWATLTDADLTLAVMKTPATAARNTIQASADVVTLTVKKYTSGATSNLQEWQDDTGAVVARVGSTGNYLTDGGTMLVRKDQGVAVVDVRGYGTNFYAYLIGKSARGTLASPTATQDGDNLMVFGGRGYPNVSYDSGVAAFKAVGTHSASAAGAQFVVFTTLSGTLTQVQTLTISDTGIGTHRIYNATTNAVDDSLIVTHQSSGTPTTNFGLSIQLQGHDSTTIDQGMSRWRTYWTTATHASRTARAVLSAYDTAERDCISWEASGSAAKVGFLGAAPAIQQTQGATLTNNITSGGTANTLANYTSLTTYSTDAAAIRNNLYQLGQTLKTVVDALRTFGLLS